MSITLTISPHGKLFLQDVPDADAPIEAALAARLGRAFEESASRGLLHLATAELQAHLPPAFAFARDLARDYLTRLSKLPASDEASELPPMPPPARDELGMMALNAPPMRGLEYLNADALAEWWAELDALVRSEARSFPGGILGYLREKNPLWRLVGRVTFHLAENKRNEQYPFAFMATYASRLSSQAKIQHLQLGRALQEYADAKDRSTLLSLLMPVHKAAERSALIKELVDSRAIYQPLLWTPREAYRFLRDIPLLEESGLIVQVPNWWSTTRPPRPVVNVRIGAATKSTLGIDALMDFRVGVNFDGEPLTEEEIAEALSATGNLIRLKGKWVEIDREKLEQALTHWKDVALEAQAGGISFFEGMRLLAGASLPGDTAADLPPETRAWAGIEASGDLEQTLREMREPAFAGAVKPPGLNAELRPYQQAGVNWLRFVTRLGLGACLADDMGLGKTIQVISLLLFLREEKSGAGPSLLVAPASLIANWKSELSRFAPSLSVWIAHPSETPDVIAASAQSAVGNADLVITTYGMLHRVEWLRERRWRLAILDEAQAIKNSGSRQTKSVKELKAAGRIVLTGTPIENRVSDLWSIFDFINPGLLGGAKQFAKYFKDLAGRDENPYAPLRKLVRPYILRRLKTDKRVIADLPDKVEMTAYCGLSARQVALYQQAVEEMQDRLAESEGIQRRGMVLAYLMRFKQICNHPAQMTGDGDYDPRQSGKFQRLSELCEELAERQEKALVFTQFREITPAIAEHLQGIFKRPGLVLTGQTAVGKRRALVEDFQREDGPPFFVLSLKAGGSGLNLTAASHVIHFDRWWNPAVENQATDRAFRIGQKRNVFVHKFVCRGTVEDKIDELIAKKLGLAKDLLDDGGAEVLLTEMSNDDLLRFVALDINKSQEA